jgi:hypothetical protein
MTVSGGLGLYDPNLATIVKTIVGPDISRLAQTMLQDPSITQEIDAVDNDCKASETCKSYLIAGPSRTVLPWPFTLEMEGVDAFRLHDAPFYQVDMWNVEQESELYFNRTSECNLYGGVSPKLEFSMSLCMKQHSQYVIVAGELVIQESSSPLD